MRLSRLLQEIWKAYFVGKSFSLIKLDQFLSPKKSNRKNSVGLMDLKQLPAHISQLPVAAEPEDGIFGEAEPSELADLETINPTSMSNSTSTETLDSYITGIEEQICSSPRNNAASPDLLAEEFDLIDISQQTPTVKRSIINSANNIREFDPLGQPRDWMINFESPNGQTTTNKSDTDKKQGQQQLCLLIDAVNSTPKSIAKYTDRDLENLKVSWTAEIGKEFELVQIELAESQTEKRHFLADKKEMETTLQSWDQVMTKMIAERENDRLDHTREVEMLKVQIEKLCMEKDRIQKDADIINAKYKQSRLDNEDFKESESTLKSRSESLEADLTISEKRYEALKAHATEKLNSANIEIHKVRTGFEKDLSFTKSKLSLAELQLNGLEKAVEIKAAENMELTKICDELVLQIENMTGGK